MKKILTSSLILLALLVSFTFCCGNTCKQEPVPPKHEIEYSVFEDDSVSEYRRFYVINYDKNNNISGYEEYTYDEKGRLVNRKFIDKYGNTSEELQFFHDEKGRPVTVDRVDGKGRSIERSEAEYDSKGNRIEYRIYKKDKLETKTLSKWDGNNRKLSDKTYDAKGNLIEYTESGYDRSGRPKTKSTYDADGNIKEKRETVYNKKGKISENKVYNADGNVVENIKYDYNSRGRLSKKSEKIDGKEKVTKYEYNSMGQVTKYTVVDGNGKFLESKVSEFTNNGYLKNEFFVDKNGNKMDGTVYLYEGVR